MSKKDLGFKGEKKSTVLAALRIEKKHAIFIGEVAERFFYGNWTAAHRKMIGIIFENKKMFIDKISEEMKKDCFFDKGNLL